MIINTNQKKQEKQKHQIQEISIIYLSELRHLLQYVIYLKNKISAESQEKRFRERTKGCQRKRICYNNKELNNRELTVVG